MANAIYTAYGTVVGGRGDGRGESDDGALRVKLRLPKEMGGGGGGTNPEQLLAVGYASCFVGSLEFVGRRDSVDLGNIVVESAVGLIPRGGQKGFKLEVELDISIPRISDTAQARKLVGEAYAVCAFSQALRGNVEVVFIVNDERLT